MKTCTHPLCDCFCTDAIGVVTHWHDTGGAPYDVPCPNCEWRDDWEDGRSDQFSYDAEGICQTCEGSGLKTLKTLEQCPWIIDGFTYAMAGLERMFLGPEHEDRRTTFGHEGEYGMYLCDDCCKCVSVDDSCCVGLAYLCKPCAREHTRVQGHTHETQ